MVQLSLFVIDPLKRMLFSAVRPL
uniref:Uncharacterized protein n=1 Tax=Anguilla anguilla TaxID=7936 RepID=A0A0E9UJR7_ANGAN